MLALLMALSGAIAAAAQGAHGMQGGALQLQDAAGRVDAWPAVRILADAEPLATPDAALARLDRFVPPGGAVTVFVSSPVWVQVALTDPHRPLQEEPVRRPSDTWFGPSTREGELCYAAKTRARMDLAEIHLSPARALTRIHLRNTASQTLNFARIKIPIGQLGLFTAADGRHWTEGLSVDIEAEEVECRVDANAPAEAGEVTRIAEARSRSPGVFRRTIAALVS